MKRLRPEPTQRPPASPARAGGPQKATPLPAPALQQEEESSEPLFTQKQWVFIASMISLLVGFVVVYYLGSSLWYNATSLEASYYRSLPDGKYGVDPNAVFGAKNPDYNQLRFKGKGLIVHLFGQRPNQPDQEEATVELPSSPTGNVNGGLQDEAIKDANRRLRETLVQLNAPRTEDYRIFADNTDGDKTLPEHVASRFDTLKIGKVLSKGGGLSLRFHQLTATPFYKAVKPIVISPRSSAQDGQDGIQLRMQEVLGGNEQENSAIASGLFNALSEEGNLSADTRILLFSDLHENYPATVSFETGPLSDITVLKAALADPAKKTELKKRLQALKECPDLKQARVDIYLPPNAAKLPKMLVLFELWREIFKEHNASEVELHY